MRTTITLDDRVLAAAKRYAAQQGATLSAVIEDALRTKLAARPTRPSRRFKLVTFRGTGPRRGVNLDRTSELLELDDIERYARDSGRASR